MLNMLKATVQSHLIKLTEEEKDYLSKSYDEDLIKFSQETKQSRERLLKIVGEGGSFKDFYKEIESKGKQYIYDDPVLSTAYRIGGRVLAEIVSKYVPDKNAQIIDVGAGSGYLSMEVKKLGYKNIDCLEPCKNMIDLHPDDLFGRVYEEIVSHENPTSIDKCSYDCVMMHGVVYSGQMEIEYFPEIFRILKPGGCVIFNTPDYFFKTKDYGVRMDAMLQDNLENGTVVNVSKERGVYVYPTEDATIYIVKKAL